MNVSSCCCWSLVKLAINNSIKRWVEQGKSDIEKISSLHAIGAPVPPAVGGALFWRVLAPLGKRAHQNHASVL